MDMETRARVALKLCFCLALFALAGCGARSDLDGLGGGSVPPETTAPPIAQPLTQPSGGNGNFQAFGGQVDAFGTPLCLTVTGGTCASFQQMDIEPCSTSNPGQNGLTMVPTDHPGFSLRNNMGFSKCPGMYVGAHRRNDGSYSVILNNNNLTDHLVWNYQYNTLQDPVSHLCMAPATTTFGSQIVRMAACNGAASQEWQPNNFQTAIAYKYVDGSQGNGHMLFVGTQDNISLKLLSGLDPFDSNGLQQPPNAQAVWNGNSDSFVQNGVTLDTSGLFLQIPGNNVLSVNAVNADIRNYHDFTSVWQSASLGVVGTPQLCAMSIDGRGQLCLYSFDNAVAGTTLQMIHNPSAQSSAFYWLVR